MSQREWTILVLVYALIPIVLLGGTALTMWLKQ